MKLSEIQSILDAEILTGSPDVEINTACGCDLMSDVLAFVKDQSLLLTGLINAQVIRTAEMMDIVAVCFVRGKKPADDVIELAAERGIAILTTAQPLYSACGKLYQKGLGGRGSAETL
ncbi:MAG: hypothetical protein IKW02_03975 [Clostridia bacterium]|nr:hypothetical protein [Clostridia bacterium]